MRRLVLSLAMISIVFGARLAGAEDTLLTIEQIPEEKKKQQEAKDEGLLDGDLPERCQDPEIAAEDPACVVKPEDEDSSEEVTIPLVADPESEDSELIPGVTINPTRPSR